MGIENIKGFGDNKVLYGGSAGLLEWKGIPLKKSTILEMPIEQRIEISDDLFEYFRKYGFPYHYYDQKTLKKEWERTKEKLIDFKIVDGAKFLENKCLEGNKITHHFNSKEFYSVDDGASTSKTMIDAFNDDASLMKVIHNRMAVTYFEGFHMHGAMLRQGFRSSRVSASTSIFNTMVAKKIYDYFTEQDDFVFDYSMGFGQRMLAALSLPKNLTYIACDPWTDVYNNNLKIVDFIGKADKVSLNNIGTENFVTNEYDGKVAFAFSSPPYFTKEIYDRNNSTQAYSNKSYEHFVNAWWDSVVQVNKRLLKPDGILGINTVEHLYKKHNLLDDMLAVCYKHGFVEVERFYLGLNKNHFDKFRSGTKDKAEPIVFLKKE